jgi:hypothetical protein
MSTKSISTLLLLGLGSLFLAPQAFAPRAIAQSKEMAVVVNSDNPVVNLSSGDLRKVLAGTKRLWPGGQTVKIITRGPGCPERLALLKLLAMSENEYKQYWTAQVLRGEADSEPLVVPSVGMQKEALRIFPGAISLVNVDDVRPGMKMLKVDGLLPGATGYPLH